MVDGFSIRFQGTGQGGIDRIKIPLEPGSPINVGAGDFTLEWWLKANPSDNDSSARCNENDGWIYGNILFDRDVWGDGDYGDFGIAVNQGSIAFGVNNGAEGTTLCASVNITDGSWHHIAVTRETGSGQLAIYVDGNLDVNGEGPTGDISYRIGRSSQYANDPFLVIGAEKHDAGAEYPSFRGWIDEVRISEGIRYSKSFVPLDQPLTPDETTLALFHFDEGPAGACTGEVLDAAGQNTAYCQFGGAGEGGPVYEADEPFGKIASATLTATLVDKTEPATRTPAPVVTTTVLVSATQTAMKPDTQAPKVTEPAVAPQATPTEIEGDQTETAQGGITPVHLLLLLVALVIGVVVGIFLVRPKK